jgi:peroxiredoxin
MKTHLSHELFAGKKVLLFAVPGAFTPTCSEAHLPGYVRLAEQFKAKGVDIIACVAVNDAFVMNAWGKAQQAEQLMMLADGDASFSKALGLEKDTGNFGGLRSQRYAMLIDDLTISILKLEPGKGLEQSKAENLLALL